MEYVIAGALMVATPIIWGALALRRFHGKEYNRKRIWGVFIGSFVFTVYGLLILNSAGVIGLSEHIMLISSVLGVLSAVTGVILILLSY